MSDPYSWPGTDCLKNKLGVRDGDRFREVEAKIVSVRDVESLRSPVPGFYDLDHLRRIHTQLFQDVYDWAGETRTVDIEKPGARFAHWRYVDEQTSLLLATLDDEAFLHGRSRRSFVERLAHYYGELNVLHPFREGNGRTQRTFLRQLALGAGWRIDWSGLSRQENIDASRVHLQSADSTLLQSLLDPLITSI